MMSRRILNPGLLLGIVLSSSVSLAGEPTKEECIEANETAQILRQAGKLSAANAKLAICTALSCPGPVRQDCAERAEELKRAIPTVVFDIKDAAGHNLLGVNVTIDGNIVGTAGVTAVPLDPGPHTFRFELPGAGPVDTSVVLLEGETDKKVSVVIPRRRAVASRPSAVASETKEASLEASTATVQMDQAEASTAQSGAGQRTAAWITGGTGLAAMGAGVVLGLVAKSSYDGAAGCSGRQCDEQGLETSNAALRTGNVATVVLVAGAVATTTGAVLWLTAPRASANVAVHPRWDLGLTLGGGMARATF
jgi:hypothetical protein